MSEAETLRYALRSVGNELSVEGQHNVSQLMLRLASFADDRALNQLASLLKEMAKVND